jgi:hypothetical protein
VVDVRGERWWVPLAFILPGIGLAWSELAGTSIVTWAYWGGYGVIAIGMVVRAVRPSAAGRRTRSAASPAINGFDVAQSIYLARPDVGPVHYGWDGPTGTTEVVDLPERDPGDLRPIAPSPHHDGPDSSAR